MKKRISTAKKSLRQPSRQLAPWSPEGATILSTMEFLTTNAETPSSDDEDGIDADSTPIAASREAAIEYLCHRLSLPRIQTLLVTYLLYHTARYPRVSCDIEDLSNMMRVHPLRMMQMNNDLAQLEDLGYIVRNYDVPSGQGWSMSREAYDAFTKNQSFDPQSIILSSNLDFLERVSQYIDEGMRYDSNGLIAENITRLMKRNSHLQLVVNLQKMSCDADRYFMLIMMVTMGIERDKCISPGDMERMFPPRVVRTILQHLRQGSHPFCRNGHIEAYNQDGMTQFNLWVLTQQAWVDMLGSMEEAQILVPGMEDQASQALTRYTDIVPRQLFFSSTTQEQVNRLMHFLSEKQYANICQALKQRGMPTGFCCLFYGTPGTGKTELVQQLAIATQRDLFQVDLSTLRDKYVGESEKQVKRIFDRYRALVRSCERAPILFFNEADGIFGNRMENTLRSVDKMENAIQNIILQEMESLEGIMICTTNLTTCLDKAFDRRFLFKLEFDKPTNEARKCIWQSMLEGLNDEQATYLANHFDFSGGQIQNISRKQVINAIFSGTDDIDYEQVKRDCQDETISRNNGRKIGF
jgi:hypothetical protein